MVEEFHKGRPHKVPNAHQIVGLLGDLGDHMLSKVVIRISFLNFQTESNIRLPIQKTLDQYSQHVDSATVADRMRARTVTVTVIQP